MLRVDVIKIAQQFLIVPYEERYAIVSCSLYTKFPRNSLIIEAGEKLNNKADLYTGEEKRTGKTNKTHFIESYICKLYCRKH